MLNEVKEANRYLEGKDIVQENLYRVCFTILKLYHYQGMSKLSAREAIFEWATKNGIYIPYSVNSIIGYIWDYDKRRISECDSVRVSDEDIREINRRFDRKKTKLVALALLCYGKVYGDSKGEFSLSYAELSAWVGLGMSSVRKIYVPELIGFNYIATVNGKGAFHKHSKVLHQRTRFKLLVPVKDEGEHIVTEDVVAAADVLFD